ncbi:MAG: hypothetical protein GX080_01820 [Tissierellia bacterium]|nr:hypothetical protein [Tissierellia bacterium]
MREMRKLTIIILVIGLFLASFVYYAVGFDKGQEMQEGELPQNEQVDEGLIYDYIRFTGRVMEINQEEDLYSFLVEREDEEEPYDKMIFTLEEDAILVTNMLDESVGKEDIKVGTKVSVFFHKDTPVLDSYPSRAGCDVVAILEEGGVSNVEVYEFDKDLVSTDGILMILPDEKTIIVDTGGNKLTEEAIKNKKAIVLYEVAELSLPAKTVPKKVIVFD